jgi:hypothetical protein
MCYSLSENKTKPNKTKHEYTGGPFKNNKNLRNEYIALLVLHKICPLVYVRPHSLEKPTFKMVFFGNVWAKVNAILCLSSIKHNSIKKD